ncbi:MAG: 4Fe-4S double cluster binding domain-containing protein [Akkermansia muciniphila]
MEPDAPVSNGCGSCRRCAALCPTGAIMGNGQVDAGRCLPTGRLNTGGYSGRNPSPDRHAPVRVRYLRDGLSLER